MEPPLIGITAGNHPKVPGLYVLRWDYIRSIESAGGVPIVLAPSGAALHSSLIDRLDGLLLTGGMDLDPAMYGETPHPATQRVSKERDEFETILIRGALLRQVPILCICRGLQLLNVVLGGSLIQDIPSCTESTILHDDSNRQRHEIAHDVTLLPGTRLHRILNRTRIPVNSFHHQSAKQLAADVIQTACADDEIIEGIELPDHRFCIGVQWHPEAFWKQPEIFGALFHSFVDEAAAYR